MTLLNATHDPALRSWVESANAIGTDFPIQNLPFGVFRRHGTKELFRGGVAIGDFVLDVGAVDFLFSGAAAPAAAACHQSTLNALMGLGPEAASALRAQLSQLLCDDACEPERRAAVANALVPMAASELALPARIGGFTDFFASIHHASNAGRLFRPDQPLLPNYKYVPIAYNGRANSVRVSGVPIVRPRGQVRPAAQGAPVYAPADRLDYEVELGVYIGAASQTGQPVSTSQAWRHVFGFCLLNDWSARDIQSWEYQPLGPFLAKSFATSVSPWVVTAEALAPFRLAVPGRDSGDPAPLPYLWDSQDQQSGALAIQIDAHLCSEQMRHANTPAMVLSRSSTETLYWTVAQMVAHHTSNGSALDSGDLLGSGTISGPSDRALGSLLEITAGGARAMTLPSGEERRFLADGDEVVFTGVCERAGQTRIGFGECRAIVLPCSPQACFGHEAGSEHAG